MQMAVDTQSTGALALVNGEWQATNWQAASENVRRLQARIVKAEKAGRQGKVKALQRLLTHSFSGKAMAVKRVTENEGKKTAGVDGIFWNTPEKKMAAVGSLKQRGYKPLPLKRVYIPKSNGKRRPLGIPTMKDRAMQALYLLALDPVAECRADPNSYGFRKERSCADAMARCFQTLAKRDRAEWVLEGDIKACFDQISHEWLLTHVPMDTAILRKWLKAGYMQKRAFYETESGTPQGGIISPVLANIALDGLEKVLRLKYPLTGKGGWQGRKQKVNLVRYADDFVITGASKQLLETEVKPTVEAFLRERGLELSQEKTVITHIAEGFDFLGQNVRKYEGVLRTKPSKRNVKAFLSGVRGVLKANKQETSYRIVLLLEPKIRGWTNFHRHAASKRTFSRVDNALFQALWRWARRRHPNQKHSWIARRYFGTQGSHNWCFFGVSQGKEGPQKVWLSIPSHTRIVRHTKVKGEANPYDPAWEVYFEERLGLKMASHLRGRRQLSRLWKEQQGKCPVCQQLITRETGWHNHHLTPRVYGGADRSDNRVLVHPECHKQVHYRSLSVSKPRPAKGR